VPIDPIKWSAGTPANPRGRKGDFVDYLHADITYAKGLHDPLISQWVSWLEQYRAPVKQPMRNTPYEGAANYMLPMTATDVDQLYAKFIQTIHATDNLWTLSDLNEKWTEVKKPMQDFLQWLDGSVLRMYNVDKRVFNEMVKLGTGIYKHGWTYERRPVMTYDDDGRVVKAMKVTGKPFVDHVKLANLLFPPQSLSLQPDDQGGAPWVAEKIRVPVATLKWMADSASPYLPNISKEDLDFVIRFEESSQSNFDASVTDAQYDKASSAPADFDNESVPARSSESRGVSGAYLREIELYEVHARFPTQGRESQDDVIVWYHMPTQKMIRGVYQYYHHLQRPYEVVRYFPSDGFYGIGVCEQKEVFQLMSSDLFNFNWDNVILSNSRMIVAKAGANIAPGEPIYPWKIFTTEGDVRQDFGVFPMADIYPSLPNLQAMVQQMGERRTGIGDLQIGNMQSLPGRTPATTTLSLLQEGNRRPDMTIKDMRHEGLSKVGLRILQICQQFMSSPTNVGGKKLLEMATEMLGQPEGQLVAGKLSMPMESIESGLGCSITATSGTANKEVERQNYLALLQLAGQVSQQVMGLAQMGMQGKGTPIEEIAQLAINGQAELFRRLLEQYDIRNPESILPVPSPQVASGQNGVPAGPVGGPGAVPPVPSIDPSVANLYGGAVTGV
jgi:hypothetical protein